MESAVLWNGECCIVASCIPDHYLFFKIVSLCVFHIFLQVNGVLHYLPLSLNNGAVNVYRKGVHYFMATDFGLLLSYDLNYFLTLTVPGNYKGQTSGLCGNFNDNPKDDLQQPDGSLTADLNVFTGSWEVHFPGIKCERGCIGHNCMANDKTDKCPDAMSSQGCLPLINGNAFKQCRAKVDPRVYYDNCAADSCTSKGDPKVVCDNMAAYALRCHLSGIKVNWRTDKLCRKLYARHVQFL